MADYATIQARIDRGLGRAAQHLGQPYSAYRVGLAASGDFPDGWSLLAADVPIYRRVRPEAKLESAISRAALFYDLVADMSEYMLGDVFLLTDPEYTPGQSYGPGATSVPGTVEINAVAFSWHMPVLDAGIGMGTNTGARLTHLARIYRAAAAPATRTDDGSLYWKSTHDNDEPLVLANGTFSFGAAGSGLGSLVPVGLMNALHPAGKPEFDSPAVPGMIAPSRYYCYVPPLPGYEPREGDAIVTIDDQRFMVEEPYRQETGVVGSQMMCERFISQAG